MSWVHPLFWFVPRLAGLVILTWGLTAPAIADAQVPKQIRFVVGTGPGGGFDQYARFTAKHMEKHFPGNPTIVVQNMPGAGGVRALSWLATVAPDDGSAIATMSSAAVFAPLQAIPGATYDATKFNYLISLDRLANFLLVWHTTPYTSAQDAFDKQIIIANAPGPSAIMPIMYNRLIGTKFKVVTGFNGTNEVMMALERGEGDGAFNLSWSSITSQPRLLNEKLIRVLIQLTFDPIDDPRLAQVPTLKEYVKEGVEKDMLEILLAKDEVGRAIIAPETMPADLVASYRTNFLKVVNDTTFQAEARERQMPLLIWSGTKVEAYVKRIYAMPPATVARLQDEMKKATEAVSK